MLRLENSLNRRRASLTELMFRLATYSTAVSIGAKALVPPGLDVRSSVSLVITIVLLLCAYFALRTKRHVWAARLFTYPFIFVLCWVMYVGGGLHSGVAVFFLPLLIFASASLGRQGLTIFALCSIFGVLFIGGVDTMGLLPAPHPTPRHVAWLELLVALAMSGLLLRGIIDSLKDAQLEVQAASEQHEDAQTRYFKAQKLEPVAQLASGIAHDFNNLLGVIANVSSSLRLEIEESESSRELLDDLDEATARASLMTGQLLAFSRRRALEMEVIDLEEFVQSLTPLLGRLLGDEILVECAGSTEGLTIQADRGQLEQVMLNLVVNARDAMPRGGRLTIEIGISTERTVFISVNDTGVGIAEDLKPRIFTAFFTTKSTGTGLGLATVADIVQRLNGTITVESSPGCGSQFRIELPSSKVPASEIRKSLSRFRTQRQSARVLLAEDHELMRRGTQRVLEQAGYTVTSVVNGQEALALIQGGARFDLLLTDVSMPHLSGFDLVEKLAEINLGLPTLFISGDARHLPAEYDKLPFPTRFLAKPFAQEDLIDAIEKSLLKSSRGVLNGV